MSTLGDFRFGLQSDEDMARYEESLYRDLFDLQDRPRLGPMSPSLIADALVDTICNHARQGPIEATDLPDLIRDVLDQLPEIDNERHPSS